MWNLKSKTQKERSDLWFSEGMCVCKRELEEHGQELEDSARFGSTYTKIGTIQRRLAWPLRKGDTQIREAFHIFKKKNLHSKKKRIDK